MKTQYIKKDEDVLFYYSDKQMTKLHREDGPAIEWGNGTKFWYLNGKCMTEQEHSIRTKKSSTIEINGRCFTVEELNELIKNAR